MGKVVISSDCILMSFPEKLAFHSPGIKQPLWLQTNLPEKTQQKHCRFPAQHHWEKTTFSQTQVITTTVTMFLRKFCPESVRRLPTSPLASPMDTHVYPALTKRSGVGEWYIHGDLLAFMEDCQAKAYKGQSVTPPFYLVKHAFQEVFRGCQEWLESSEWSGKGGQLWTSQKPCILMVYLSSSKYFCPLRLSQKEQWRSLSPAHVLRMGEKVI